VAGGVQHVDAAGQYRDGLPVGSQCRSMRRAIDAVGPAGDHGDLVLGQAGREIGGDVLPVCGCGTGSDDCGGALGGFVKTDRSGHPQRKRESSPLALADGGAVECGEREQRPFVIVRGHEPAAASLQKIEIFCSAVGFPARDGVLGKRRGDLTTPDALGGFHRADGPDQAG